MQEAGSRFELAGVEAAFGCAEVTVFGCVGAKHPVRSPKLAINAPAARHSRMIAMVPDAHPQRKNSSCCVRTTAICRVGAMFPLRLFDTAPERVRAYQALLAGLDFLPGEVQTLAIGMQLL